MRLLLSFIKKELLLFVRSPDELLVLLAMPLLLIMILGFALGSLMNGDVQSFSGKVALVNHSNEEEEMELFLEKLTDLPIPTEAKEQMEMGAKSLLPITMLKEQIFNNEELESILTLEEVPSSELEELKTAEQYSAIIEVPPHFTSKILELLFIEEKEIPALTVYSNEGKELSSAIVEDIVGNFQEQYSVWANLGKEGLLNPDAIYVPTQSLATVESLSKKEPIGAFTYYTIGMGVMFILFIASSVSSRSFLEKKWNVLDRILLANVPAWAYAGAVFISTIVLAALQMLILYGVAAIAYGVHWPQFSPFFLISLALALATGGIAVLLMAINHRLGSESASKLFMSAFVAVLSFVGGSFTPVGNISELLVQIGQLTPNGAAMTAYMKVMQGAGVNEIIGHLFVLLGTAAVLIVSAWFTFPRKERA
ncbi:ABC transporter permease [Bacillus niameyensis]|uniref:ABC transporter permease n=1 Tax=Bacillus niameyensis TaxID=1522308 RepID=UPI000785B458|nr:ABC transporter permease [Bacillus niameyensis]